MQNLSIPRTDKALLSWSSNVVNKIGDSWESFGLAQGAWDQFVATQEAFAGAMAVANDPARRTMIAVSEKNASRASFRVVASGIVNTLKANANLSEAQRIDLGLAITSSRSAIAAPEVGPMIHIVSVKGRTATIQLGDESMFRRGRAPGAIGAAIFIAIGEEASTSLSDWSFFGNTNKTTVDVTFPTSVPNGATVWFTAQWYTRRCEHSPAGRAVSVNLPGGGVSFSSFRIAA